MQKIRTGIVILIMGIMGSLGKAMDEVDLWGNPLGFSSAVVLDEESPEVERDSLKKTPVIQVLKKNRPRSMSLGGEPHPSLQKNSRSPISPSEKTRNPSGPSSPFSLVLSKTGPGQKSSSVPQTPAGPSTRSQAGSDASKTSEPGQEDNSTLFDRLSQFLSGFNAEKTDKPSSVPPNSPVGTPLNRSRAGSRVTSPTVTNPVILKTPAVSPARSRAGSLAGTDIPLSSSSALNRKFADLLTKMTPSLDNGNPSPLEKLRADFSQKYKSKIHEFGDGEKALFDQWQEQAKLDDATLILNAFWGVNVTQIFDLLKDGYSHIQFDHETVEMIEFSLLYLKHCRELHKIQDIQERLNRCVLHRTHDEEKNFYVNKASRFYKVGLFHQAAYILEQGLPDNVSEINWVQELYENRLNQADRQARWLQDKQAKTSQGQIQKDPKTANEWFAKFRSLDDVGKEICFDQYCTGDVSQIKNLLPEIIQLAEGEASKPSFSGDIEKNYLQRQSFKIAAQGYLSLAKGQSDLSVQKEYFMKAVESYYKGGLYVSTHRLISNPEWQKFGNEAWIQANQGSLEEKMIKGNARTFQLLQRLSSALEFISTYQGKDLSVEEADPQKEIELLLGDSLWELLSKQNIPAQLKEKKGKIARLLNDTKTLFSQDELERSLWIRQILKGEVSY